MELNTGNDRSGRTLIRAEHLGKSFTDVQNSTLREIARGTAPQIRILDDLNFEVRQGELLGVIGRNGAGKSTLLRLLANVYHPTSGTLKVASIPSTLFEMGVFLDQYATGRKYCKNYFEFLRIPPEKIEALIQDVEAFIEIGAFFEQSVHKYSSGMKARLLFAVATAQKADLYLIDEALVVGDEYFQGKAWKRLYGLLDEGASGVIVTHDMDSVVKLCDDSMLLRNGTIAFYGKSHLAVNEYLGLAAFASDEVSILDKTKMGGDVIRHTGGETFTFRFSLQVAQVPKLKIMTIAFSVEKKLQRGGIIHVCKQDNNVSAAYKGVYEFEILIEDMDIAPGEYYCTLTVGCPPESGEGAFEKIYDEKRWIPIEVTPAQQMPENKNANALLNKKVSWSASCI